MDACKILRFQSERKPGFSPNEISLCHCMMSQYQKRSKSRGTNFMIEHLTMKKKSSFKCFFLALNQYKIYVILSVTKSV